MAKISSYAVIAAPSLSDLLIGTDVDDSNITKNFSLTSALTLFNAGAVPTATSTGVAGQLAVDASYLYVCYATNSWKKVALVAI